MCEAQNPSRQEANLGLFYLDGPRMAKSQEEIPTKPILHEENIWALKQVDFRDVAGIKTRISECLEICS